MANGSPSWRDALLKWYDRNGRDLPWRRTREAYAIWISEIMLQQTQVATGLPYYERWMRRFPTVESLAAASEEEVLGEWQGLGYYRRAKMLRQGAGIVAERGWPTSSDEWRAIPGVGPYTAGAIASISLNEASPVVDGNVERVYARMCADSATGSALHQHTWRWAGRIMDHRRPGDWNQALMELGATICRPVMPRCRECPLRDACLAFQLDKTQAYPVRRAKVELVPITQFVWVPMVGDRYGVRKVEEGPWWVGLFEFPRADSEAELIRWLGDPWRQSVGSIRHTVTKHRVTLIASVAKLGEPVDGLRWHTRAELAELPMPSPQRRLLKLANTL